MDMECYKRKTQMVLYSIESELGGYASKLNSIENISGQLIKAIVDREESYGNEIIASDVSSLVSASYFNEVIDLAVQSASNTNDENLIKEVRTLIHNLNLIEIRNNVAHPNREVTLNDWFKVACVSSNQKFEQLKVFKVKEALISAENNILTDPPKEWLELSSSELPNNLPSSFEHDSTGLVGRTTEVKKLSKDIYNKRITSVAVVAPGGVGKTALVLDMLQKLSLSNKFSSQFDGIVYVSLKNEQLTTDGIKSLTAIETISELKEYLIKEFNDLFGLSCSDFEALCEDTENIPVLVFIDNLETLIRDNSQVFDEFNLSLPTSWKVIITSRLNVSNANTVALDNLKEDTSTFLARKYQKSKGGLSISEPQLTKLVNECNFNPLAIKLTLDYFNLGNEIPTSTKKANIGIAEFSFKNLVDSLHGNSIKVLELLFVLQKCSRKEICHLLDLTVDDSAASISELSNTSLLKRINETESEKLELNSTVREFLLLNPRNLEIRKKVQQDIRKSKDRNIEITKNQNNNNTSQYDEMYIPEETSRELRILIHGINKTLKVNNKDGKLGHHYQELNELKSVHNQEYIYHRTMARILQAMHDNIGALSAIKLACKLNKSDVASLILKAKFLHADRDYDSAEKIYSNLISSKESQNIKDTSRRVWLNILNGYFIGLIHQDKFQIVLDETKTWNKDKDYGSTLGTYRATAYKRKFDSQLLNNEAPYDSINSCLKILGGVFKEFGYFHVSTREAVKIIETLCRFFTKSYTASSLHSQKLTQFLDFCSNNIVEIFEQQKKTSELSDHLSIFKTFKVDKNPFLANKWKYYIVSPASEVGISFESLDGKGYERVQVFNIPKDGRYRKTFIIAIDAYENRYFIHKQTFNADSQEHFYKLQHGDPIAIKVIKKEDKELAQSSSSFILK